MGYYVVAIGGTGNKILESVVYGACAGAFYTLDENGARRVIPRLDLISVDVDAACGNTTRAKRASEYYEDVRRVLAASQTGRLFRTELCVSRWNMNLSLRAASVNKLVENHARDQLLSRTIFSKTEASLEYSEGFRGHPDLGVLFFADLIKTLGENELSGQPDEMLDFIHRMVKDIERGETVRVLLCGSIFGGTGASGIPALARYLRERFREHTALFELGGLLMLPYYSVPVSTRNEEAEIVVRSDVFLDKARTALQYYGMSGLIRDGESDEGGVFDALHLLGLPPESFVTARNYSTGSQSQENDAHMLEWLATRQIASFLRTGFRGENAHNIDCYYYQWHTPDFRWQSFDSESTLYRMGYGAMLKAAAAFFSECYPSLRAVLVSGRGHAERVGYLAPYFSLISRMSSAQHARLEGAVDSAYHFFAFYVNWFVQVVRTLPPTMRKPRALEQATARAAEDYARLMKRAALLTTTDVEDEHARELRAEYDRMLAARDAHIRAIGGEGWLNVLRAAQLNAREALSRQENDVEALREQLESWRGEDSHLADPQTLRLEEERLHAMERTLDFLREQLNIAQLDVEAAIREELPAAHPAPKQDDAGALPQNSLADAETLDALYALLCEYGSEKPDQARIAAARERVQGGLHTLLGSDMHDRRTMARVVMGLGGGDCDRRDPQSALAGFLSTLLNAVMEEEIA